VSVKLQATVWVLPKVGYFIKFILKLKLNRIITTQLPKNDRAKPFTLRLKLISETELMIYSSALFIARQIQVISATVN